MRILLIFLSFILTASCSKEFVHIPDGYDYNSYKKALKLSEEAAEDFVLSHNLTRQELDSNLIRRIEDAVKSNVIYEYDEVDTIKTAQETLYDGAGDCEDHAILVSSVLKALKIRTTIIRRNEINEGEPGHVFAAYAVDESYKGNKALSSCGTRWLALDTTFDSSELNGELGMREGFNGNQYRCFNKENDNCCLSF